MTVVIVLSILALVLSPMAWLRPSRNQSGKMSLRMAARRMGLAMQLTPVQWPHWFGQGAPDPCAQYHRPRRPGRADQWVYWQSTPGEWLNQWREPLQDARLQAQFERLPGNVFKVEATAQLLSLFWGEKGEEKLLQDIAGVLDALA
jgi:hypothetical protein